MRGWMAAAALMTGMSAGAGAEPVGARPGVQVITYETTACYGTCPVYRLTVRSDGQGVFEGREHTAIRGPRTFRVSARQWRNFRDRLAALHGRGAVDLTDPARCAEYATDLPGVEVRWSGAQRPSLLKAYYGCDMDRNEAMFRRLRLAPGDLPIRAFIAGR